MIEKWFEPFTLLERHCEADGMGGERCTFSPLMTFRGALSYATGNEINAAGQLLLQEHPVLLHEFDVTLAQNDHVLREKDSAVYRVTGRSDSMRSPAFSGLRFAQVPVERVVIPC